MYFPWIDLLVALAAMIGAKTGRKKGFGLEAWRILRRLFPAIFGFGLYKAMAAMLVKLPGLQQGPARFWGFILIFVAVMLLMHKGRSRFKKRFTEWGNRRPKVWASYAGAVRSLMTSFLALFLLSLFPLGIVRNTVLQGSWLVHLFQYL